MSSLWRKSLRDLVTVRWQAGGLMLLVAVVVTLMAGAARGRGMLAASRADALERLRVAHLDVRCSPTLPDVTEAARDVPGVAAVEERMLFGGVLRAEGIPATSAVVRVLPEEGRPEIHALELLEGRWPEQAEEALLVDRSVPRHRRVGVGDTVRVEIRGVTRELPIVGTVLGSEHTLVPAHPDFEIPIPGALAVLHMSAAAAAHYEYADRVDSLLFRFEDGADRKAIIDRLRGELPVAILAMITDDVNAAARMGSMILRIFDIYMPTVACFLIAVALALFVMTVARIVRRQHPQIGTLLAIGHRPLPIALSMLAASIVPTVLGGLLGALAHPLIARRIFDAHVASVGWPPLVDPGPGPEAALTVMACAGVAIVACLVPALLAARRPPTRLLRPQAWTSRPHRRGIFGHLGVKIRDGLRLPLSVVLGLTTVLRRRWATATAAVALAANFAIVLAFLFVHTSHNEEIQATFDRLGLDGIAYFDEPQIEDVIREKAPVDWTDVQSLITRVAWFDFASGPAFVRVTCLQPDGWISQFALATGRPFASPDADEVCIDHWAANTYGLRVGDRFTCYPYFSAPEGLDLTVSAIVDGMSLGLVYMPLETGRRLYELPGMCTGVHIASDMPREAFVDSMRELPSIESVVVLSDARDQVAVTFSAARYIVSLAIALSVIVAVIFLGILSALDANERSRDLAILRSLGWRDRAVVGLCVTEVMTRGYLALLLALPAAPLVARWILGRIQEANGYRLPLHDPAWAYLTIGLLGAALIPLGAVPAWRAATALPTGRIPRLLSRE